MTTRTCPSCGAACKVNAKFCVHCRHPLGSERVTCPNGHVIDPSWKECPFCLSEASGSTAKPTTFQKPKTVVKDSDPPPPSTSPSVSHPISEPVKSVPRMTEFAGSAPARAPAPAMAKPQPSRPIAGPRATQFAGASGDGDKGGQAGGRKIVAVLASFSSNPAGDLFSVWTGRNIIGSGGRSTILVEDPQVSEQHAIILARGSEFLIDDNLSTNGTFLNGREIREKTALHDGDIIKTGSTLWRFVEVRDPHLGRTASHEIEDKPEPAERETTDADADDGFFLDQIPD